MVELNYFMTNLLFIVFVFLLLELATSYPMR